METGTVTTGSGSSTSWGITTTPSHTTMHLNTYSTPERVSVEEIGETIEMVFVETSTLSYLVYPPINPERRVFKIIYSCKDGKWHKSNRVYGEIVPAQEEEYYFK